jgi:hypothetical protein
MVQAGWYGVGVLLVRQRGALVALVAAIMMPDTRREGQHMSDDETRMLHG